MKRQKLCVGLLALILAFASFAPATQVAWAEDLPAAELASDSEQENAETAPETASGADDKAGAPEAKQETGASADLAAEDSDLPAEEGSEEAAQDESPKDEAELPQAVEAEEKTAEPEAEEKIAEAEAKNSGAAEEEGEASPENVDAEVAQPEQKADPAQDAEETPTEELDQKPAEEEAVEEAEENSDSEPAEETAEPAESSEEEEAPASESADSTAKAEDQAAEEDSTEAEADQSITLDETKAGLTDSTAALADLSAQLAPPQAPQAPSPSVKKVSVDNFQSLKDAINGADTESGIITEITISSNVENILTLNFDEGLTIRKGSKIRLLNAKTAILQVTKANTSPLFTVEGGAELTLDQLYESQGLYLQAPKFSEGKTYGPLIYNEGTLTINKANFFGYERAKLEDAAIVTTGHGASFDFNDGLIINQDGTAVSIRDGATMTMSGGKIADNKGAGIMVKGKGSSFTQEGGVIELNTGIGVSISNGAQMTMNDGVVGRNNSYGILVDGTDSKLTLNQGKYISDMEIYPEVFNNHKAGVGLKNGAHMEMSGGSIKYNWEKGVQIDTGSSLTLSGGSVELNYTGGVRLDHGSKLVLEKRGGISANSGPGIIIDGKSSMTMTGGAVSFNRAGYPDAGGVNVRNGSSFVMIGGGISSNHGSTGGVMVGNHAWKIHDAYKNSGNLNHVPAIANFVMTGGVIRDNRGYFDAGGLYVSANARATMMGGEIIRNATDVGGGGVLVQDGYLVEYAGQSLKGKRPKLDHESWKKAFPASFTMYGGTISQNKALGLYTDFGQHAGEAVVDGDGGGILIWSDNVNLYRGTISDNYARNHGGGIHVKTVPYHLTLKNVRITGNEAEQPDQNQQNAEGQGGGVWVCPIGLVEIYANQGSLIHNNSSNRGGDDFYSMPKAWYSYYYNVGYPNGVIFISSKTLNGQKIVWVGDPDTDGITGLPFDLSKSYKITEAFGLKSLIANPNEAGFWLNITGNHAGAGGGVATNGHLTIGEAPNPVSTDLSGRKELLSAAGRVLSLKGHNFEIERIIGPTEEAYPDILRGYTIDDLLNRVTVEENGTFSFGNIKFTLPGPYVFEVREILGDEKGIIYDPHIYRVTFMVEVDEDNNRLVLADTIIQRYDPAKNPGDPELEDLDELVVTNQVEPEPSSYLPTPEPQPSKPVPVPPPIISKAFIQKLPKTASVLGGQHK